MTKKIASIYFEPVRNVDTRPYPMSLSIPAVKKADKPFLLEVKDHYQVDTLPWFRGTFNGRQRQERYTIPGELIAEDLLREWTQSHPDANQECHPGIWVVRDVIPLNDENGKPLVDADGKQQYREATADEKAAMFKEDWDRSVVHQLNWCEKAIQKGDLMAEKPAAIPYIPQYCKDAAVHCGRERKWLFALKDNDVKSCPFCTAKIAVEAVKCPNCNEVVDQRRYQEQKKSLQNTAA